LSASESPAPPAPPEAPARKRKMLGLVIVAVLIVAALAAVAVILLSAPTAPPPPPEATLDRVTVTPSSLTLDVSQTGTVSARAFDTDNREQTANVTFAWSANPSAAVRFVSATNQATAQFKALQGGSVTVTVTATWKNVTRSAQVSATFGAVHFVVTADKTDPLLGEAVTLTVAATKADSTPALDYTGTVVFTSDDPQATLPTAPATTFQASNFGTKAFSGVIIRKAGAVVVNVDDTEADVSGTITLNGNRPPLAVIRITPNAVNPLQITADGTQSSDLDSGDTITAWAWAFGDGGTETGATAAHTYAEARTYTVVLSVTDSHGAVNSTSQSYVARAPPFAAYEVLQMNASGVDIYVRVNATGSGDPDGTITSYNWTWGDGTYSNVTANETYHIYDAAYNGQTVTLSLRVTDNDNLYAIASQDVTISIAVLPPLAIFTYTVDQATRTVDVDASESRSPQGRPIVYYNWTWGDGNWDNVTTPLFSHRYSLDGLYTINLTVGDSLNLEGYAERVVTIAQPEVAPNVYFNVTRTLMRVEVDANATWDLNGNIAEYDWGWGDAANTWTNGTLPYAEFTYPTPGKYTITLVVKDSTLPTALENSTTKKVSVATSTLDYTYWDFMNVLYGEWWDYRAWHSIFDDRPINANCFNETAMTSPYGAGTVCTSAIPGLKDFETYPYTNWYPLPGNTKYWNPGNNPLVYAPYRFRAVGVNIPGYNVSEPVFLPVMNYGEAPAGDSYVDFDWKMQYLDYASATAATAAGCPGVAPDTNDGFKIRSVVMLTMDLAMSRRIFGVVGGTVAQARSWWNGAIDPTCSGKGSVETALDDWFIAMGGGQNTIGKYDIVNTYEWYYQPMYTNMSATVDDDGTTHVTIDHAAWGTEALLARMFYWGNASYADNYLDSTKATGWWDMELAWFEDFSFVGTLHPSTFDFDLTAVQQYHFQIAAMPGADGFLNRIGDIAYWTWGPILSDYTNDALAQHPLSELDRYPTQTYLHATPGSRQYNKSLPYDYVPIAWDLPVGHTWHFEFPRGDVIYYDPNNTPIGANPQGGYVEIRGPLKYLEQKPAGYGDWDGSAMTWDVVGPANTGGPSGAPGNYPLEPWGSITFVDPPMIEPASAEWSPVSAMSFAAFQPAPETASIVSASSSASATTTTFVPLVAAAPRWSRS